MRRIDRKWRGIVCRGLVLPKSHNLTDDDCAYIGETLAGFVEALDLL